MAAARTAFLEAMKPALFKGPTTTPKPPVGKKLAILEWGASASAVVDAANGAKAGATLLGWKTRIYDGNFLPSTENSAILDAVSQHYDAIFTIAVNTQDISSGMRAAHAAHIPVIDYAGDNPIGTGPTDVYGWVDGGNTTGPKILADYLISKTNGKAVVGILHTKDFTSTVNRYDSFKKEIQACSGCSIAADVTYASSTATQNLGLQTTSMLSSHPNIQYVFVDIGQFATVAAKAIGGNFKTKVVGFDCNPDNLQAIRDGKVELACWASSAYSAGWAAVDQSIRAILGQKQSNLEIAPVRLFDASNLPAKNNWDGDFVPATQYRKLWSLGG